MRKYFSGLLLLFTIKSTSMAQNAIRCMALGDSYTIGTGAKEEESWPVLLVKHLKENKINIELTANPSRNGFTTLDLIDNELPVFDKLKPNFVTLLIGVNDWVRGTDAVTFQKNLIYIIDHVQNTLPDKSSLLLLTIPDFGVTPTGANYSSGRDISKGISEFNNIIKSEAAKRSLKTVDLFETSKAMKTNSDLVADDGLHPSAKEYAIWETIIYPVVHDLLGNK